MAKLSRLKRKLKQTNVKPNSQWKIILFSSVRAMIMTMVVLLLLTFLITYSSLPEKTIPIVTVLTSLVFVLMASRRSAKRIGKQGWLNGGLTGLSYMLLMAVFGSIFVPVSPFALLIGYWPLLLTGILGGIWGV